MKRHFAGLSKAEREKVESAYHRRGPEDFNELMSRAKQRSPKGSTRSVVQAKPKRKGKSTEKRRAA
jgi:hypothetical protein